MIKLISVSVAVLTTISLAGYFLRFLALKRPALRESSQFFRSQFEIVAHRGGSLEAPENTLIAFEQASKIAPDILFEFDIHQTKNGELVVFHDPTLERTTNGQGLLKEKTLAELQALDAGFKFQNIDGEFCWRGKGVQIPTLETILSKFQNRMIIEFKSQEVGIENKAIELLEKYQAQERVMIASEHGELINRFRQLKPKWNYGASKDDIFRGVLLTSAFLEPIGTWPANAYLIPEKEGKIQVLTSRFLNEVQRRGKKLLVWTVNNDADMKRLKTFGVNGLITDRPSVAYKFKNL